MFVVTNLDNVKTQKVLLTIREKEGQDCVAVNFKVPSTPIPCQIMSKREREIVIFTKQRPFEESWGDYEFDLRIDLPKGVK